MSYNGSGTFNLYAGNPVVTGTTISSTWANNTLSDIATGLSNCMTRDGQSPPTANIPMGGFKLTNLANGSSSTDSATVGNITTSISNTFASPPALGSTTPAAVNATTLSASSTVSGTGFSIYLASPPAIGSTTPAAVKGTTITATTNFTFPDLTTQTTAATGFGFKNRIINGEMKISQRGTSFATPASLAYTLDRWFVFWLGAAPASVAQVAGPTGFKNALRITGAASNTSTAINHRVESYNCSDLSGATITIQANIAVSSAQTVLWVLRYANATDNFSALTVITSGTWSATTTATTFTATISSLPAGATNGLELEIYPQNGTGFTSGTIDITGVQLEKGATATPFDYRPYGTELALCQRYLPAAGFNGGDYYAGLSASATAGYVSIPFKVSARIPATGITTGTVASMNATNGSGSPIALTTIGFTNSGTESALIFFNVASGLSTGQSTLFNINAQKILFTGCEL